MKFIGLILKSARRSRRRTLLTVISVAVAVFLFAALRAVLDGFNAGASVAYPQSSPMGLRVYERLGFQTLETWSVWITP